MAIATACTIKATPWLCGKLDPKSCDGVETVPQRGIGSQICLAKTTYWVCREFEVESCENVKTEAPKGIECQHCLGMVFEPNTTSMLS